MYSGLAIASLCKKLTIKTLRLIFLTKWVIECSLHIQVWHCLPCTHYDYNYVGFFFLLAAFLCDTSSRVDF